MLYAVSNERLMWTLPLLLILAIISVQHHSVSAQSNGTQVLRGSVRDVVSDVPIAGATVRVYQRDSLIAGYVTRTRGEYRFMSVPVGRYRVVVSMIGYEPYVIEELAVTAGKETLLPVALTLSHITSNVVSVTADRSLDEAATNNEFVAVSGHTFRPEETRLYPGSIGDPSRMVQNYAGVLGANDARNDIVVRGNSPLGVLYRMEGMNIPNPSHYGALTSAGGVVNMLNNNVLAKSDFIASAFPAEYGNATSGVFDLRTRRGNDERYEFVGQMSFSGVEAGVEGPISDNSSFLINYRYSTLATFAALGLDVGVGSAVPVYQDINFNLSTEIGSGRLTLFGTAGVSRINFIGDDVDTTRLNAYAEPDRNINVSYASGWSGLYYEQSIGSDTYVRFLVGGSATRERYSGDSLVPVSRAAYNDEVSDFSTLRWSTTGTIRHRASSRLVLSGGYIIDGTRYSLYSVLDKGLSSEYIPVDVTGATLQVQAYGQASWRPVDDLQIMIGVHSSYYTLGTASALEPRLGVVYQLSQDMSLRAGLGMHSQAQNIYVYNVQVQATPDATLLPNSDLDLTRSRHATLEWQWFVKDHTRLRVEGYAQWISRAPVERRPSSYSALNAGADFFPTPKAYLVNEGTGVNRGLEFTLERFMRDGLYYMLTASVFSSTYSGSDDIIRNTAFNNGYVVNALAGYTFGISTSSSLTVSARMNTSGGRFLTPVDLQQSQFAGRAVYDESNAFSERQKSYFRTDVRIGYQMELEGSTLEIAMDLMNVTNHENVFIQTYNARSNRVVYQYQQGFIPVPTIRWTF